MLTVKGMVKGWASLLLLTGMLVLMVAPASAADLSLETQMTSKKDLTPETVCLNENRGHFLYRTRPRHCIFYDAGAPGSKIIKSAKLPTRAVAWRYWGNKSAMGQGRYKESGTWLRMRVRLDRPRVACGQNVFTRIRVDIKTCGGDWTGWSTPTAIERCP